MLVERAVGYPLGLRRVFSVLGVACAQGCLSGGWLRGGFWLGGCEREDGVRWRRLVIAFFGK